VHHKRISCSLLIAFGLILSACGGGGDSSPTPPPLGGSGPPPPPPVAEKPYTNLEDINEAARFMIHAGLGAETEELNALVGTDAAQWLRREFAKPRTDLLTDIANDYNEDQDVEFNRASEQFWTALFGSDDALRMRMTYALSQTFVISDFQIDQTPTATAYYQDILAKNAFGNFRDVLQDVTYSPAMADFLTYMKNRKGNPETGRMPDENYAREILQLFTIGLVELNMDGTPKLSGGEPIETYNNDDIRGLAKVFTGLSLSGDSFYAYRRASFFEPLQMYDEFHSDLEKNFLGTTIPAGTTGDQSIDLALDAIFEHPNVPPLIARQLIQRFTASDPEPAYISRVANSFADGRFRAPDGTQFGTGQRGDLQATLAAILLDESIHEAPDTDNAGKVREPVLKLVHWARAFGVEDIDVRPEYSLYDTSSPADLGQHPFRPKSVFNFYRPGFIAPGTQSGEAGMTAPEYQIINEGSVLGYINLMTNFVFDRTGGEDDTPRFTPDYSYQIGLADDPAALVDNLNTIMTGGQMSGPETDAVVEVVEALVVEDAEVQRLGRVRIAVLLIASTPSYAVIE